MVMSAVRRGYEKFDSSSRIILAALGIESSARMESSFASDISQLLAISLGPSVRSYVRSESTARADSESSIHEKDGTFGSETIVVSDAP